MRKNKFDSIYNYFLSMSKRDYLKFVFDLCLFMGWCGLATKILILTYQSSIGYKHWFHPICYLDSLFMFGSGFYFWVRGLKK